MTEPLKTLSEIQAEIGSWSKMNFGHNVSRDSLHVCYGHPLGSLPALLGVMEELGELCRVVARRHQGRGYENALEAAAGREDAVADLLVFLCDFCSREGIILDQVLNTVWARVQKRRQETWAADKAGERLAEYQARSPATFQDGHGYGHTDEGEGGPIDAEISVTPTPTSWVPEPHPQTRSHGSDHEPRTGG